jgi:hypothetical protein
MPERRAWIVGHDRVARRPVDRLDGCLTGGRERRGRGVPTAATAVREHDEAAATGHSEGENEATGHAHRLRVAEPPRAVKRTGPRGQLPTAAFLDYASSHGPRDPCPRR